MQSKRGNTKKTAKRGGKSNGGNLVRSVVLPVDRDYRPMRKGSYLPGKFPPAAKQVGVSAAYATQQRTTSPKMEVTRDHARIIHRELIGSITGSAAFTVSKQFALNPGLAATFPWLATQAQGWEQYRFNRMRFCYYTRTGTNVPGSCMLVPDYDAADAAPASEQIASAYENVREDAPWKDIDCVLSPTSMHAIGPKKFIRLGSLAANLDIKTYDVGNFFLLTTDGTAVPWGKLWVEYDVEFFNPQLNAGGGGVQSSQHQISLAPTNASFQAAAVVSAGSSNIFSTALNVLTFNVAGRFLVNLNQAGTSVTRTAGPTVGAGAVEVLSYGAGGPWIAGDTTAAQSQALVVDTVVGGTITYADTFVGGNFSELIVSQLPNSQA